MATLEELARLYQASRMSGGGWPMVAPSVGPAAFAPPVYGGMPDAGAVWPPPPAGGWGGGQPPRPPGPAPRPGPQPMPPPRPMPPAAIPPSMNQPAPMSWWQRNAALQREGPGGAYLDPEAAARALASRG